MHTTELTVAVVRAEPARFRHPLLLLHGLWTGNWIWRDFAAHLANRGWESWAPSLLRGGFAPSAEERIRELRELCEGMAAPPVVIAHDAAVATAAEMATAVRAPAVVALAPWSAPRGRLGLVRDPHLRGAGLMASRVAPPPPSHPSLVGIAACAADLHPDSSAFVRALAGRMRRPPGDAPGLVLAGRDDPAIATDRAEQIAADLGWSFDLHDTPGHFPMLGRGSERVADRVHRWIVQATGEGMLLQDEDENGGT
jgi:hypothetical protein